MWMIHSTKLELITDGLHLWIAASQKYYFSIKIKTQFIFILSAEIIGALILNEKYFIELQTWYHPGRRGVTFIEG